MPDWLLTSLITAAMTWGALRVEIRYLRRDVDRAHLRLDALPCNQYGRRSGDAHPCATKEV